MIHLAADHAVEVGLLMHAHREGGLGVVECGGHEAFDLLVCKGGEDFEDEVDEDRGDEADVGVAVPNDHALCAPLAAWASA